VATQLPSSIQAGAVVYVDTGANAEAVVVTAAGGNTFSAVFQMAHSGTYPVVVRGNPGPQARFNPHSDPTLVPYFSIID
jgi:hypothetical protein